MNISDALTLKCTVVNNTEDEKLVWLRKEREIKLEPMNQINVSTVCIDPVAADDNDVIFSCHLRRNSTMKRNVLLDVRFIPILSRNGDDQVQIYNGLDVTLSCNVKSNPPAVMTWYKDNNILKLVEGKHRVNWDSGVFSLSIKKVQNEENGTYLCMVNSVLGSGNLTFHLNVKDKPDHVPYEAISAGVVVILLTCLFGIISRRNKIIESCKTHCACDESQ
ncbi:transmembrane and immunoglobulin domain-containing protein 1-like isoform X1 [Narcine bancroftii]|uniref:transmembrane and immunoglobulin domain-containing protein 1-like isoform X1 n=1 Tax=Narcine bancroftii TaxID=1343680 RepID=UPI003831B845